MPTLDSQSPDEQETASQRPSYGPIVNAVPKVHDASEDEITGHHIVDYIVVCVCSKITISGILPHNQNI